MCSIPDSTLLSIISLTQSCSVAQEALRFNISLMDTLSFVMILMLKVSEELAMRCYGVSEPTTEGLSTSAHFTRMHCRVRSRSLE